MTDILFKPFQLGSLTLKNRILMAPMTRNRAGIDAVPTSLMATYYKQRASAGLIITEASQISAQGQGYPATPGIFSEAQIDGWKLTTDAVHTAGGLIFNQLWHVGRVSHPWYQEGNQAPVAPSAIPITTPIMTPEGPKDPVTPRALETEEITAIAEQYRNAAACAKRAGFDGVEIHAANGYLIDQFLRDGSNKRTDEYGGSIQNRARFLLEVIKQILAVWDSNKVGVRLSPVGSFNDMSDSNPEALYSYVLAELSKMKLAYIHIVEAMRDDLKKNIKNLPVDFYRTHYDGTIIINSGYTKERAAEVITSGTVDLVSIGIPFIANPDLVERFKQGAPLNEPDTATFYGGDARGYTDYPALSE